MKTTWTWIVVGLIVLLLLTLTVRERFGESARIKNPANWTADEVTRIRAMVPEASTVSDSDIRSVVGGFWSYSVPVPGGEPIMKGWSTETRRPTLAVINEYLEEVKQGEVPQYLRSVFRQLIQEYYIKQGETGRDGDGVFVNATGYNPNEFTDPIQAEEQASPSSGTISRPTLSNEKLRQDISVYAAVPRDDIAAANLYLTQLQTFYDTVYLPKKILPPSDSDITGFVDSIDVSAIPDRYRSNFKPALVSMIDSYFSQVNLVTPQGPPGGQSAAPVGGGASSQPSTGSGGSGGPPPPGSAGGGATSGTSTGGSSGTSFGPNSGGTGSGRNVWGPLFLGLGDTAGPINGDSTKTNAYPVGLGGLQGRASTRLEGVGIVPPSGGAGGGGGFGLPTSSALGSDANSMFLPFSRQPGDMDLVPDPYRLATNFSASSYTASKTDPVPFLTDFSSFYK